MHTHIYIYIYIHDIYTCDPKVPGRPEGPGGVPEAGHPPAERYSADQGMVAIFCPFSKFCEMNISLLSLQTQPNAAPNLYQRGVEYGKYDSADQG